MNPEEAQIRAEQAKQLLRDPMLIESFNATQEALVGAVKVARTQDESYKAAVALQVFDLIKGCITSHIETAKVIEFNSKRTFVDKILGR
jgi:glycerol-3-phosphate acyltransferase PlsY